nr:TRAP transporter small permease [Geomicrobium halophilum]
MLVILTSIMVIITALQIFMRFVLGSSLEWSEELARYCFIWMIYIGISYGVKKQRHIKVDVLMLLFKDKGKVILNMIANVIFLAFAIFIVIYGTNIAVQIFGWGQTSPGLGLPMAFVYFATPAGMSLTVIRLIQQLVKQWKFLQGSYVDKDEVIEDRETDLYGAQDNLNDRKISANEGGR